MLYPGYQPFLGRAPMVLHYGSDFTVDGAYFNKVFTCLCRPMPPWATHIVLHRAMPT